MGYGFLERAAEENAWLKDAFVLGAFRDFMMWKTFLTTYFIINC
jgi:hypothetical protein